MNVLAIDTSGPVCGVCILADGAVRYEAAALNKLTHSTNLMPMVDTAFAAAGMTLADMDRIAVVTGPGSFTGVRIGVAAIKGFAFGKNKICVGTSTLDALARNAMGLSGNFLAVPVMDARRSQLYNAIFEYNDGELTRLCEDRLISAAELEAELAKADKPIYFFGDGYAIADKLNLPQKASTPKILIYQNAAAVAASALHKYETSEAKEDFTDLALSPKYLRASQAEREEERKRKEQIK